MFVNLSLLESEEGSWGFPECISQQLERSEQNPLLFVSDGVMGCCISSTSPNVDAFGVS